MLYKIKNGLVAVDGSQYLTPVHKPTRHNKVLYYSTLKCQLSPILFLSKNSETVEYPLRSNTQHPITGHPPKEANCREGLMRKTPRKSGPFCTNLHLYIFLSQVKHIIPSYTDNRHQLNDSDQLILKKKKKK